MVASFADPKPECDVTVVGAAVPVPPVIKLTVGDRVAAPAGTAIIKLILRTSTTANKILKILFNFLLLY